jgi:hypothetical protein
MKWIPTTDGAVSERYIVRLQRDATATERIWPQDSAILAQRLRRIIAGLPLPRR